MNDNYEQPPLFDRGPGKVAMLLFYILCSCALMLADSRLNSVKSTIRPIISIIVDPIQRFAQLPIANLISWQRNWHELRGLQDDKQQLQREKLKYSHRLQQLEFLEKENERYRRLLEIPIFAQRNIKYSMILGMQRNNQVRKILLNQGMQANIQLGQPVIDDKGLIGQITRVFPLTSEVTLVTDSNQATPIMINRTGQRSIAFGVGDGSLELRHIPLNADVQVGDEIVTSGLDGLYPAGLAVAKVAQIDHQSSHSFGRVICTPTAGVESFREVALLSLPTQQIFVGEYGETKDARQNKNNKKTTITH